MRISGLIGFFCFPLYLFAREPVNADCATAIRLQANIAYTAERPPLGYGNVREFSNNPQKSFYFFEDEHHSAWYTIEVPVDGLLFLEIIPEQIRDDYDFLLYEGTDICGKIGAEKLLPVRGNISRNDRKIQSRTGLAASYENDFATSGPGPSYSKPLEVKKGQTYYLVLDNVYPGGKGHTVIFTLQKNVVIEKAPLFILSGMIKGEEGYPLKASIRVEKDATGEQIAWVSSDSVTGAYSLQLPSIPLNITVEHKGYLYKFEDHQPVKDSPDRRIDFILDSIKLGNSIRFYNLHFSPNEAKLLPNSTPDLDRLVRFMQEHPEFMVEIQGHSNYNLFSDRTFLFQLSMKRARTVRDYLVQKGIDPARINIRGFGGSKPLIISDDTQEAMKNLRVEVLLFDRSSQPE